MILQREGVGIKSWINDFQSAILQTVQESMIHGRHYLVFVGSKPIFLQERNIKRVKNK